MVVCLLVEDADVAVEAALKGSNSGGIWALGVYRDISTGEYEYEDRIKS